MPCRSPATRLARTGPAPAATSSPLLGEWRDDVRPNHDMVLLSVHGKNRRAGFAIHDQAKARHSPRLLLIDTE